MTDLSVNRLKRDGTADLLKGLAVLFMIQVHIMEQFASPDTYNSMIGKISLFMGGPVCAPVFLAVMGYFLAFSGRPMLYFIKRGVLLFLGGILLNTARSANLLIQIMQGNIKLDPWFFIMGADILTLAGLSLILTAFLRVIFRESAWLYFMAALAVAAVSPLLNQVEPAGRITEFIFAFLWGTAEWAYFPVFPWFAYVLAGYAFCLFIRKTPAAKKIDIPNQVVYFIPLWIGILLTIPYAAGITYDLEGPGGYYHHGILFFGWVLLFMAGYAVLIKLADHSFGESKIAGIIKWTGQKVTVLYVIQWLIIGNIATWLYKSQNLFQYLAWFIMVTLITLLFGWLGEKTRLFRK
jgi:uncharacterized membrane protein